MEFLYEHLDRLTIDDACKGLLALTNIYTLMKANSKLNYHKQNCNNIHIVSKVGYWIVKICNYEIELSVDTQTQFGILDQFNSSKYKISN